MSLKKTKVRLASKYTKAVRKSVGKSKLSNTLSGRTKTIKLVNKNPTLKKTLGL